jgi:hypothetical protein
LPATTRDRPVDSDGSCRQRNAAITSSIRFGCRHYTGVEGHQRGEDGTIAVRLGSEAPVSASTGRPMRWRPTMGVKVEITYCTE